MRLDSWIFVGIVALLALVAVIIVPVRWDGWRHRRAGRTGSVLFALVGVILACASAVNSAGGFFPTPQSLFAGSDPGQGADVRVGQGEGLGPVLAQARQRAAEGRGFVAEFTVTGKRTQIRRSVLAYIPAAYTDPAMANARFPVVEWFTHFAGSPGQVVDQYGLAEYLDRSMAERRMAPAIVLIPDANGEPRLTKETECIDAVNGEANDTYLTADIRDWAQQTFRVRTDRDAWALAGWSSGGYCAMNLAFRHPQWYSIAVSMSGYAVASPDVAGQLFKGRTDIREANDVLAHLRKRPAPIRVLASATRFETTEVGIVRQLRAEASPPVQMTTWMFADGGHNPAVVREHLPATVDWLAQELPAPVITRHGAPSDAHSTGIQPWPLPNTGAHGALQGTEI